MKKQISQLLNVLSIILMLVGFMAFIIWNFHVVYAYIIQVVNAIRTGTSSEEIASLIMLFFVRGLLFFGIFIVCELPAICCKVVSVYLED